METTNNMLLIDYSQKAIAIAGDRDHLLNEEFILIGGKFNPRLSFGAGWIFSKQKSLDILRDLLEGAEITCVDISKDDAETLLQEHKQQSKQRTQYYKRDKTKLPLLTDDEKLKAGIDKKDYALKLSNVVITYHPKPLKTEFHFGYSSCGQGPSYEDMSKEMERACKDEGYFISENLSDIDNIISRINGAGERPYLWLINYNSKPTAYNWSYEFNNVPHDKPYWLIDEDKRKYDNGLMRPISDTDKQTLLAFMAYIRKVREKRCMTYLKRHRLSKLKIRSYWMDY